MLLHHSRPTTWILQRAEKNADEEDVVLNVKEIGEVAVEARVPVI